MGTEAIVIIHAMAAAFITSAVIDYFRSKYVWMACLRTPYDGDWYLRVFTSYKKARRYVDKAENTSGTISAYGSWCIERVKVNNFDIKLVEQEEETI